MGTVFRIPIKMNKRTFLQLLHKKNTGRLTSRERALLHQVLDQLQSRELTWELGEEEAEEIERRVKQKIDNRIQATKRVAGFSFPLRLVASLVVILCLGFLAYKVQLSPREIEWVERHTNERQKATITLPDGSLVSLNTNTRLRFPKEFVEGKRVVELDGEAFFEVVKDNGATFEVHSQGIKTVVLGTAFNIRAHQESPVQVAVQSGKVAVYPPSSSAEAEGVELHPNQRATEVADSESFFIEEMNSDSFLDWKAGSVTFNMDPFDEVIQRLATIYNYKIDLVGEGLAQCQIKATYVNGNLFAVLYGLKNLAAFEVENTGERALKITYKKCKI